MTAAVDRPGTGGSGISVWASPLFRRTLGLIAAAVLLSGCSSTRLIYNQLDWFTVWRLDSYFSLDNEQEDRLREIVDRNFEWHRRTQLPRYAEYCRQFDRDTQDVMTPDLLGIRYDEMLIFWDDFMLHIIPDAQLFLSDLTPEQLNELFEKLEESNQEMYEKYSGSTPEQRQRHRDKASIRGIQMLTGKLNDEQKDYIKATTASMEDASEDWIENRRIWQVRFVSLLKEKPPPDEYRAELTELFVTPRKFEEQDYRRRADHNLEMFLEMMATLMNQLDDRQRARMSTRLSDYAGDFDLLAAQGLDD